MKARNRKTGEIVEVISWSGKIDRNNVLDYVYYIDSEGNEHTDDGRGLNLFWDFETAIEDKESMNLIDWESFRRNTAKDIVTAYISTSSGFFNDVGIKKVVKYALSLADELIKQLKDEGREDKDR